MNGLHFALSKTMYWPSETRTKRNPSLFKVHWRWRCMRPSVGSWSHTTAAWKKHAKSPEEIFQVFKSSSQQGINATAYLVTDAPVGNANTRGLCQAGLRYCDIIRCGSSCNIKFGNCSVNSRSSNSCQRGSHAPCTASTQMCLGANSIDQFRPSWVQRLHELDNSLEFCVVRIKVIIIDVQLRAIWLVDQFRFVQFASCPPWHLGQLLGRR